LYSALREQERHGGLRRELRPDAEQQHEGPERADGRVGQDTFEVGLHERLVRGQQHRDRAHATHDVAPQLGAAQDGTQPREQVYPGFHHRRRVQVGAGGRWRLHRARQPEVERELGGLRERRQQDQ
jgi:hypothetical protein